MMEIEKIKGRIFDLADQPNSSSILEKFLISYLKDKPLVFSAQKDGILFRCSENRKNEIFYNVERCSFNPKISEIPLGRCNYPAQQVLYCSVPAGNDLDPFFPMAEVMEEKTREQINQNYFLETMVTISRWEIKKPLNVLCFPFSSFDYPNNNYLKRARKEVLERLADESTPYKDAGKLIELYRFFGDILVSRENRVRNYKIGSSLFNAISILFNSNGKIFDGMIYPSSKSDAMSTNIVLKKETVEMGKVKCSGIKMCKWQPNSQKFDLSIIPQTKYWIEPDIEGNFHY